MSESETSTPGLKFAIHHINAIRNGKKYVTARYGLEHDLRPGDRIDLLDDDGARFANARVCWVGEMTAAQFVRADLDGHRSYASVAAFLDEIRSYYPDAEIGPDTPLTVLVWSFSDLRLDTEYDGCADCEAGTQHREAERFWSWYDIPFDYGTAIKVRRSGLSRGSWGDGRARDTVVHLHVKEGFSDGRLSRSADSYLCDPGSHVTQQSEESPLDGGLEQKVTCETCVARMERWKLSPEEMIAQSNAGTGRRDC